MSGDADTTRILATLDRLEEKIDDLREGQAMHGERLAKTEATLAHLIPELQRGLNDERVARENGARHSGERLDRIEKDLGAVKEQSAHDRTQMKMALAIASLVGASAVAALFKYVLP